MTSPIANLSRVLTLLDLTNAVRRGPPLISNYSRVIVPTGRTEDCEKASSLDTGGPRGIRTGRRASVFESYRFDNLETDESHILDGWSYVWAALGGPVYVLIKGFVMSALVMLVVSAVIAATATGALVFAVGFLDHQLINLVAVVAIPAAALVAQGVIAIELVRMGYIRRGWREGY